MRALLQRVDYASVTVKDRACGEIKKGILAFIGFSTEDSAKSMEWMINKIVRLRIFEDSKGKMNLSLLDIQGSLLLVSQFTLYGDCRKGNRPNFMQAASPERAECLYKQFVSLARNCFPYNVQEGSFGDMMKVRLQNDGPVTVWLEKEE